MLYSEIDSDASGQLSGIYSDFTVTLTPGEHPSQDVYSKGINAEHFFSQSMGAGNEPQRSDMHNLYRTRRDQLRPPKHSVWREPRQSDRYLVLYRRLP